MRCLIDAFNVLHAWKTGPATGSARTELPALARLIDASSFRHHEVTLVCDGAPPDNHSHRLRPANDASPIALYAGPGKDADALIERLIRQDSAPRRLTVVSSDRRLQRAARKRGAAAMTAPTFLARIVRDAAAPAPLPDRPPFAQRTPLDDPEVQRWLAEFGISDPHQDPAQIAGPLPDQPPPPGRPTPAPDPDPDPTRTPRTPKPNRRLTAPPSTNQPNIEQRMLDDLARDAVADPDLRDALMSRRPHRRDQATPSPAPQSHRPRQALADHDLDIPALERWLARYADEHRAPPPTPPEN